MSVVAYDIIKKKIAEQLEEQLAEEKKAAALREAKKLMKECADKDILNKEKQNGKRRKKSS